MTDHLRPDRIETLASSIVSAYASRNALDEGETPALIAKVRSVLEGLARRTDPISVAAMPRRWVSGFAPPRRRVDPSRAPWRSAVPSGLSPMS